MIFHFIGRAVVGGLIGWYIGKTANAVFNHFENKPVKKT